MMRTLLLLIAISATCTNGFVDPILSIGTPPTPSNVWFRLTMQRSSSTENGSPLDETDVDDNDAVPVSSLTGSLNRRKLLQSSMATTMSATTLGVPLFMSSSPAHAASVQRTPQKFPTPPYDRDLYWPTGKVAFSLLPLAGTNSRRATVQEEVVKDSIWTHDQIQGVVNVNVPVRQTVIRLESGGLWVHNPVAPTPQLIKMMRSLENRYGPVKHIVLGTVALGK